MHHYQAADTATEAVDTAAETAADATEVALDATAAAETTAEISADAIAGKSMHSLEETISIVLSRYT